jgi:uncharacterized membrane protein YhaH (DUF805 family)
MTDQWMVLRKRLHRSGWWVLAGAAPWVGVWTMGGGALLATSPVCYVLGETIAGFVLTELLQHPIPEVRDR